MEYSNQSIIDYVKDKIVCLNINLIEKRITIGKDYFPLLKLIIGTLMVYSVGRM